VSLPLFANVSKNYPAKVGVSRKSAHISSAHVLHVHSFREGKKKNKKKRKNVSAVVHARTRAFPRASTKDGPNRAWSQLATRVDRCETESGRLTIAQINLSRICVEDSLFSFAYTSARLSRRDKISVKLWEILLREVRGSRTSTAAQGVHAILFVFHQMYRCNYNTIRWFRR